MAITREYWTEDEVLALPAGEDDNFDRKAGGLVANIANLRAQLGAALSAFANSGGGHVFLGVRDNGTIDGVTEEYRPGKMSREWLEQLIPSLTDYPLKEFRVQVVMASTPSQIPPGRVIIAINVADSQLAPHQSKHDSIYYCRQSGHSKPAPHVFVDLLRHRPSSATLAAQIVEIHIGNVAAREEAIEVTLELEFVVQNTSRSITANTWEVNVIKVTGEAAGLQSYIDLKNATRKTSSEPILPGCVRRGRAVLPLTIRPKTHDAKAIGEELALRVAHELAVHFRAASDTWHGMTAQVRLIDFCLFGRMADEIYSHIKPIEVCIAVGEPRAPEFCERGPFYSR